MHYLSAGLLAVSLAATAGTDQSQQTPALEFEPIDFTTTDGRSVPAEQGSLQVPARRGVADSEPITLRFVRFPSTNPEPGHPIVYLAGGPGGAGTSAARGARFRMFEALREVADVIAFDQRGTGLSDRLPSAPGFWGVSTSEPVERAELEAVIEQYAARCAAYWLEQGVDLAGFQTEESADDLEDLRKALGAEQLQLVAISYGTHLALATLRRHPQSIARVVLAGTEGPDHTVKPPSQQQALLEEIARRVQLDPRAREQYPDFLGDLREVLERARKDPLAGVFTEFDVQRWVAGMLRGPASFADLPQRVSELAAGDHSALQTSLRSLRFGGLRAMSAAMDAASGISEPRRLRIEREASECLLGDAINFPYGPMRAGLDVPDLGEGFRAPLRSSVPALFLSGTLDGRTPPENAEETRAGFTHSVHWILDGAGHSDPLFLSSTEIVPGIRDFLSGKTLEDRTIELPPVRFTVPDREPRK